MRTGIGRCAGEDAGREEFLSFVTAAVLDCIGIPELGRPNSPFFATGLGQSCGNEDATDGQTAGVTAASTHWSWVDRTIAGSLDGTGRVLVPIIVNETEGDMALEVSDVRAMVTCCAHQCL